MSGVERPNKTHCRVPCHPLHGMQETTDLVPSSAMVEGKMEDEIGVGHA
jgi:hypothetical protein